MKILEFQSKLREMKIDATIFYSLDTSNVEPNFFYFSGYDGVGALVVPSGSEPFLLAPKMEVEKAKKSRIRNVYIWQKKKMFDSIKIYLKKKRIPSRVIGVDFSAFTMEASNGLKKSFGMAKLKNIGEICRKLRMVKTPEEIAILKEGCKITDRIFEKCMSNFKSFRTESDVSAFLEYETKKLGHDVSFKPIVASGNGSSIPHYSPRNIPLKKGFCVIDFGIKYKGYCTDMTRTVFIGKMSEKETAFYNLVLDSQLAAINASGKGVKCSDVYNACVKKLGKYKKNFIHGLGHGVGVEIHEQPNLKPVGSDILDDNIVFTVEPGIYFPKKFGIRIEDTVALIDEKIEVLTNVKKTI